ncbi:MAG: hypothetical protein Kow00117_21310 [Phototrophicales bacterium]
MEDADIVFINGVYFEEGLIDIIEAQGENINAVKLSQCVFIWSTEHDHGDEAHHEDEHAMEHDHDDEAHHEDEHAMDNLAALCAEHYAELEAAHGGHLPHYFEDTLGALHELNCVGDEHGMDDHDHADDHEHGVCDPHVWMDPHNVILWVYMIRDTLSELDPTNADIYAENAAAYAMQLDELVHQGLAMLESIPQENRILITSHQTFGYMTNPIGFEVTEAVIPGGSTISELDPASFAELIDLVEATGVPAVFAENTVNPSLVEQLADEADVEIYVLLTDSLTQDYSTYLEYMRYNYMTITQALGGDVNAMPMDDHAVVHDDDHDHDMMSMGGVSGAFMTIRNVGDTDEVLIGGRTDVAQAVEIHQTTVENDVAMMMPMDGLAIPAGQEAMLMPGSYHVMLIDLTRELHVGETVILTLVFESGTEITLEIPVSDLPLEGETLITDTFIIENAWVRATAMEH